VIIGQLASGVIDSWIVGAYILEGIFFLATIMPTLSVGVRRLHDLDRSGWWVLLDNDPASWMDHTAHLVLHEGHRWSEPLRRGPAG
jgi:uncharacterized membrane protein YhaH (DUF805 family)